LGDLRSARYARPEELCEQWLDKPPGASARPFNQSVILERVDRSLCGLCVDPLCVWRFPVRDAKSDVERMTWHDPDSGQCLLVTRPIPCQCAGVASFHMLECEVGGVVRDHREVGVLSEEHGRSGMLSAKLDQPPKRRVVDLSIVARSRGP
jgi:hypothetical protein